MQRSTPASFFITDLVMPDTDGLEAVAAFRKEFPTVKIVVVSGTQRLDRLRYLETAKLIGADFTFQKPFEVEALLEALKSLRRP